MVVEQEHPPGAQRVFSDRTTVMLSGIIVSNASRGWGVVPLCSHFRKHVVNHCVEPSIKKTTNEKSQYSQNIPRPLSALLLPYPSFPNVLRWVESALNQTGPYNKIAEGAARAAAKKHKTLMCDKKDFHQPATKNQMARVQGALLLTLSPRRTTRHWKIQIASRQKTQTTCRWH